MRKRPKFQAGDIVEEFYYDYGIKDYVSYYHLILKREFFCYQLVNPNRWSKYYMYTLKSINENTNGYIWRISDKALERNYEYRRVA